MHRNEVRDDAIGSLNQGERRGATRGQPDEIHALRHIQVARRLRTRVVERAEYSRPDTLDVPEVEELMGNHELESPIEIGLLRGVTAERDSRRVEMLQTTATSSIRPVQ